jgi:SSS family transporter
MSTTAVSFTSEAASNSTMELVKKFSTPDYVVFAISLAIPLVIGVFFFFYNLKSNTTANFLMGDRSINFVAVALSILASLLNGIFVIGIPAEIHYYGVRITLVVIGMLLAIIVVSHAYAPKYQEMKFTSAYEYVERRYNYATRVVASLLFSASVIIFLAVVLYVPALSFAQVSGLSIYITIIVTGIICTIYTTIGGMKAVVYTDAIQMVILLVGLIVIAALGCQKAGGAGQVWQIAESTGRINFDNFSADPRTRHTLWTQMFGQFVTYLGLFISNQLIVQRYMAVATKAQAMATLYITFILFVPLVVLILFIGLALHATYYTCDPLIAGKIRSGDQIMPYYILDLLGEYKGIAGLLTASVFAAALSSVSAVCNSLAAVWLEDLILPACRHFRGKVPSDRVVRWIAVALVIFFGLATIGLSFLASSFTSKIIQATGTIWGVLGGPLGGIFIMGFFLPFCNSAGAISGMFGGVIFSLWVSIGSIIHSPTPATLNVAPNMTVCHIPIERLRELAQQRLVTTPEPPELIDLYNVSYAWYGVIGMGSCIVIGIVVSLATIWIKKCRPHLERELMCLCCCESLIFKRQKDYEFDDDMEKPVGNNDSEITIIAIKSATFICAKEVDSNGTCHNGVPNGVSKTPDDSHYENTAFDNDNVEDSNNSVKKNNNFF